MKIIEWSMLLSTENKIVFAIDGNDGGWKGQRLQPLTNPNAIMCK
jgi:hypothetical protein